MARTYISTGKHRNVISFFNHCNNLLHPKAVLFGWIELTLLLGRLPTFGVYAHMFNSVAGHLGKCAVIFFFFFLGFAFSFHILFQVHSFPIYETRKTVHSLLKSHHYYLLYNLTIYLIVLFQKHK